MKRHLQAWWLVLALIGTTAQAGQTCRAEAPTVSEIERGMAMAQATAAKLDASGADVLLLARAGQNLDKYGLRWSHLGFAYRDTEGRWRVLHKLNDCGTDHSSIFRQGLGEFFMDKPWRYQAAYEPLAPTLQKALLPLLRGEQGAALMTMDEPRYNMVAYAWGTRFQQSNQWALETLAMVAGGPGDRAGAQRWLQAQGYQPTVLHLSALERLGAETTRANVSFNDHPNGERFSGRIATVTADSIFAWLPRAGLAGEMATVSSR
ncbi:DUF2145 domain-containing protein [Pelomonas sp. KK5]|uniref:DUF2145 domain-containing protein n=1 Tax=Pelomonas sp. KK5 TaxID=1855730 RepID=UPI00097C483D|nr:DUF2145 domain-containing protein [Pelomonas sp. KK5]